MTKLFEDLDDPRQRGKVANPLDEMLLQCLLAVIVGAEMIAKLTLRERKELVDHIRDACLLEESVYDQLTPEQRAHLDERYRAARPR